MLRLRCAMLFVKEMAPMLAFYRDAMGFAVLGDASDPNWVELDAGGATIALHVIPPAHAADIVITAPPAAREDSPVKLIFEVPDVAEARARLASRGAVMHALRSWGTCDGLDPEGNVFQLAPSRR
ncbi:MAG: hypothetical protein IT355_14540 [Gemmatimonadaceae bacterium]|nr:hypothetical protein [Gemmatimonadaceae bacterium]